MNIYDVYGNLVYESSETEEFLAEAKYKLLYTGDARQTQGSCIDDDLNVYNAFASSGKWVKYNLKTHTATTYTFTADEYGHMNDCTFNPNDGYIYCASQTSAEGIYVFDSSDMSLHDLIPTFDDVGNSFGMSNIAFNRKTNKFVSIATGKQEIFIYNQSLVLESHIPITDFYSDGTRQGIETDGEYIYHVVSPDTDKTTIVAYNFDGTRATENPIVIYPSSTPEFESMCYDWNNENYIMQSAAPLKLWWVGFKKVIGSNELFGAVNMVANHYLSED